MINTKVEDENKVLMLLKQTKVEVLPEMFSLISLTRSDWLKLLETPELSPRMTAPFMIFFDNKEITLLLDETDFEKLRGAVGNSKVERGFRLLTFDIKLDFNVSGFIAEIARILAEAKIPIIPVSSFSRDHLLIKQNDLASALKTLGNYVEELC